MFILPVVRDRPREHTAWVVYSLILVNAFVFAITCSPSSGVPGRRNSLYTKLAIDHTVAQRFGFIPAKHEPVTVITSMFLHGNVLHILGNMIALWMFGEGVEGGLGHVLTFVCYFASGTAGALLQYCFGPHSTIPCVGASGAIAGVIGIYMALFPTAKMDLHFYLLRYRVGAIRTTALVGVLAWLGEQSLLGLVVAVSGRSLGIGFMAHVGGMIAGVALCLAVIRLGLARIYPQLLGKRTEHPLYCPTCGKAFPQLWPGHHNCWSCGTTFRVDEQGEIAGREGKR